MQIQGHGSPEEANTGIARQKSRRGSIPLACYEILLQLSPTTLALHEQKVNALPECFHTLAACIASLVELLCAREPTFDAVPLVQWLCHAVEEASPSLVKFTAHVVACILCLLSQAKSADVRRQVLSGIEGRGWYAHTYI